MGKRKNFDFNSIVQNKKIPILTLDERWHELFPEERKTGRIKELEQKVNHLLKTVGKLADDSENMKKLKKTLLGEIIEKVSGLSLSKAYKKYIITPLGLMNTYLPESENDKIPQVYYRDQVIFRPKLIISSKIMFFIFASYSAKKATWSH